MSPRGWYRRDLLPHYDGGELTQAVTMSLLDTYPAVLMTQWREELAQLSKTEAELKCLERLEAYLDTGKGQAWLADPYLAEMVQDAFCFFAGQRYSLHAWVVMPTHAHVLFTPFPNESLAGILHSWKSFTSNRANQYLRRRGTFWLHESFDRFIRSEEHFLNEVRYIENNPVKASLCKLPIDWAWSSASFDFNRLTGFRPINEIVYGPPVSNRPRRRRQDAGDP